MISATLCLFASAALPADVHTVGGIQTDFDDLQVAIDSVSSGDELRLAPGVYSGHFRVDGKSITLTGRDGVEIEGSLNVVNLIPGDTVLIRDLELQGSGIPAGAPGGSAGLRIYDTDGVVMVEGCTIMGTTGALVGKSNVVVFNESVMSGRPGLYSARTKYLYVHDSFCGGFHGSSGIGAVVDGIGAISAYFGGSSCLGGNGSNAPWPNCGGDGGHGLVRITDVGRLQIRDTSTGAGFPGQGGTGGICGSCPGCDGAYGEPEIGVIAHWAGVELGSEVPTEIPPGQTVPLTATGDPGTELFVSFTSTVTASNVPGRQGILFSSYTGTLSGHPDWQSLGTLTGTSVTANVTIPPGAINSEGLTFMQTARYDPVADHPYYGPLRVINVRKPVDSTLESVSTCNGDGGDQLGCTNCPCGNNAPIGTVGGCINGAGRTAQLQVSGSGSVSLPSGSEDDLRFSVVDVPGQSFCRLFSASGAAPGGAGNPCLGSDSGVTSQTFNGLRCAINGTLRHGGRPADSLGRVGYSTNAWGGEAAPVAGIGQVSGFVAGQTRYFQVIYRENIGGSCGRAVNTTQAIVRTFTP